MPMPEPKTEGPAAGFSVDAALVGELLAVPPATVQELMRQNRITSICERGEAEHAGQYRLTFFYRGRRARLSIDGRTGRILRRAVIDCGERRMPPPSRETAGP